MSIKDRSTERIVVPKEFDEWYQQIKQRWGKAAAQFALWKICQYGFGNGFEDVKHERTSETLSDWVCFHKNEAINAVWNGYEVEEEPKYYVQLPFLEWNEEAAELEQTELYLGFDITSDETRFMTNKNGYRDFKTRLDEETIKAIDERYWSFAEPVEEV